ncbi:MAG TPA: hypothetical protein VN372_06395 [Methanospirillum sp.]|nr:hypothetical protein [Methanospirillum sp.]
MQPIWGSINTTSAILPYVIAALVILIIGWIVGRLLGKTGSMLLEKAGCCESLGGTSVGKTLIKSGISVPEAADYLIRVIIYLLAIMSAADTLKIESLKSTLSGVLAFIPNIIAFVLIIVVGLLLVDYFSDFISALGETADINLLQPFILLLRMFLYFIVVMLALTQLKIQLDIIYAFIVPLAWGVGLGIGAAIAIIFGWGLKEKSPEMMDAILCRIKER